MALSFVEKIASYDNVDRTTYTTASLTATANRAYFIGIFCSGTSSDVTAVSGGGLGTWTQENESIGAGRTISVWRAASASPGAGAAISIDISGTCTGATWHVIEVDGQDTSGTNASGAVVQSVNASGTATSGSATLAAYGGSGNRPLAWAGTATNEAMTAENTGGTNVLGASPGTSALVQWSTTVQDTTPNFTWTTSGAWRSIALEIKAAAAAAAPVGHALIVPSLAVHRASGW